MINVQEPRIACVSITLIEDKIANKIDSLVRVYETSGVSLRTILSILTDALDGLDTMDINKVSNYVYLVLRSFNILPYDVEIKIGEVREMKKLDKTE